MGEHTNERTYVRMYSHTYVRDRPYIPSTTLLCEGLIKDHQAMLQTKFQTSEARGSEEEDFLIFSTYFYDSNLGLSGVGPFCTPPFENIFGKDP